MSDAGFLAGFVKIHKSLSLGFSAIIQPSPPRTMDLALAPSDTFHPELEGLSACTHLYTHVPLPREESPHRCVESDQEICLFQQSLALLHAQLEGLPGLGHSLLLLLDSGEGLRTQPLQPACGLEQLLQLASKGRRGE